MVLIDVGCANDGEVKYLLSMFENLRNMYSICMYNNFQNIKKQVQS